MRRFAPTVTVILYAFFATAAPVWAETITPPPATDAATAQDEATALPISRAFQQTLIQQALQATLQKIQTQQARDMAAAVEIRVAMVKVANAQ